MAPLLESESEGMTCHLRPNVDVETCKKPLPGAPTVGVFGPPMSKFVFACLARMVCSEDTMVYTGSGRTSICPVRYCSCYRHLICYLGYKQAREGKDPVALGSGETF